MRLIDADALYAKACDLEAQALYYTDKLSNDEEKRKWSTILMERTAFKYDVNSAPTIKPERKTARWIHKGGGSFICSDCGEMVWLNTYRSERAGEIFRYCQHCGAYMGEDKE